MLGLAIALHGCGGGSSNGAAADGAGDESNQLNVYSWSLYIPPDTVTNFEKLTGIKVHHDTYDSNEILETKLLTGKTNYDIVIPTVNFFERQVKAGVYRKLDKQLLGNLGNMDPDIMRRLALHDPGNQYAVPYLWSMVGIGYNKQEITRRLGAHIAPSWSLLFDPDNAAKLQGCGISVLDAPPDVVGAALIYLGKDPNSGDERDLLAAFASLQKIRTHIRNFDSERYISELANGSVCLALSWSGDVVQARNRAREAGNGVQLEFFVPSEGSIMTLDAMAIPADAPHPRNAQRFMNYLMQPEVTAHITDIIGYPNGNLAATPFIDAVLVKDPAIHPDEATRARLKTQPAKTLEYSRFLTREWTKFKTGS